MNPRDRLDLGPRHVALVALAAALVATAGAPTVAADHGDGAISHCSNPSETVELVSSFMPFQPALLVVEAGTCVEFVNTDTAGEGTAHTVHVLADTNGNVDEAVDPVLEPGESTTASFDEPGHYQGNCQFHPATMHGTVEVI